MSAERRILVVTMIGAGLALAADLYGAPRLAIALLVAVVLLLAIVVMAEAQPKDPQL